MVRKLCQLFRISPRICSRPFHSRLSRSRIRCSGHNPATRKDFGLERNNIDHFECDWSRLNCMLEDESERLTQRAFGCVESIDWSVDMTALESHIALVDIGFSVTSCNMSKSLESSVSLHHGTGQQDGGQITADWLEIWSAVYVADAHRPAMRIETANSGILANQVVTWI